VEENKGSIELETIPRILSPRILSNKHHHVFSMTFPVTNWKVLAGKCSTYELTNIMVFWGRNIYRLIYDVWYMIMPPS